MSRAGDSDNIEKIVMMNEFASSRTLRSSDPGRAVTGARRGGFLFLLVSLLVALAAIGCSGGESPRKDTNVSGESVIEDADRGDEDPGQDANVAAMFPQHDAPLGTDNGGNYHAGRLVLDKGCLRVEIPPDANGPGRSSLLIWPNGFALSVEDEAVGIVDGNGRITAHAGDHIRLSHATVSYQEAQEQGLIQGMFEDCAGPFYMVGDEVTVFDPDNEPSELRLSDPDLLFPRQRTTIATGRSQKVAEGVGELVLDGNCLRLGRVDGHGYTIIWPAGFSPHVEEGVVQVRNGAGRTIARVGDRIASGGGYSSSGYGDCPGGKFGIHSIKVLPDIEVYFPKQDGTLGPGQGMDRFVGKLVVEQRCLKVDAAVRVKDRVIMPGGRYICSSGLTPSTLSTGRGGRRHSRRKWPCCCARVGDEIQFNAVAVTYGEAMEHSGLREISTGLLGGLLGGGRGLCRWLVIQRPAGTSFRTFSNATNRAAIVRCRG